MGGQTCAKLDHYFYSVFLFLLIPKHTNTHTFHPSIAPGDYGALTNFHLGPFNNHVRQLSFNVSIVNDNIPEDVEMFNVTLTLDPADQARLGNRVRVSPEVATVTVQDNDGKALTELILYLVSFPISQVQELWNKTKV